MGAGSSSDGDLLVCLQGRVCETPGAGLGAASGKLFKPFGVPVDKNLVSSLVFHDKAVERFAHCRAFLVSLPFDVFDSCSELGLKGGFGWYLGGAAGGRWIRWPRTYSVPVLCLWLGQQFGSTSVLSSLQRSGGIELCNAAWAYIIGWLKKDAKRAAPGRQTVTNL